MATETFRQRYIGAPDIIAKLQQERDQLALALEAVLDLYREEFENDEPIDSAADFLQDFTIIRARVAATLARFENREGGK